MSVGHVTKFRRSKLKVGARLILRNLDKQKKKQKKKPLIPKIMEIPIRACTEKRNRRTDGTTALAGIPMRNKY